jgi:hypothetical protein
MTAFAADDPVYTMNETAYREIPSPGGGTTVRSRLWNAGEHRPLSAIRAAFGAGDTAYSGDEGSDGGGGDVGGGSGSGPVLMSATPICWAEGQGTPLEARWGTQVMAMSSHVSTASGADFLGVPGAPPLEMTLSEDGSEFLYPESVTEGIFDIQTKIRMGVSPDDAGKSVLFNVSGNVYEMQWAVVVSGATAPTMGYIQTSVTWSDYLAPGDTGASISLSAEVGLLTADPAYGLQMGLSGGADSGYIMSHVVTQRVS